jgi:hypothetical protein
MPKGVVDSQITLEPAWLLFSLKILAYERIEVWKSSSLTNLEHAGSGMGCDMCHNMLARNGLRALEESPYT